MRERTVEKSCFFSRRRDSDIYKNFVEDRSIANCGWILASVKKTWARMNEILAFSKEDWYYGILKMREYWRIDGEREIWS